MQKRIAEGRFENWAEVGNAQAKYEHPCYNKEEIIYFTSRLNQGREDIHKFNETRRPFSRRWKLWEILTNLYR